MAACILTFVQFDDTPPAAGIPFSCEPSTWSLEGDIGLYGCKDYRFIAAISGLRNEGGKAPLFPLRRSPANGGPSLGEIKDEALVGWLTHSEILASLEHAGVATSELHSSVMNVLMLLKQLRNKYGDERVRLVFCIHD